MGLLQSSRGVLLPQHISRVSYIYFLFLFRFGVFLASAHVQTDTYAPDLYEKTGAYLDVFFSERYHHEGVERRSRYVTLQW